MYQLIYISEKTQNFELEDIPRILYSARLNNDLLNVTGILLDLSEHFIQVLEGNQKDVESTFTKISGDSRHCNIRCIYKQPTINQEFGNWSMGFSPDLNQDVLQDAIHIANMFAQKQHLSDIQIDSLRLLLKSLNPEPEIL
ncbi:MAG: BLUF domain-containing protein [Paraglaciecola sp.]|uniref:BLUF domain-containing protein n=2 Tax=Paraglaciecola sp. TaxID=1920173 RepID=UPI003296CAF9